MKKKIKAYAISPAKGQALLNFDGRIFPDSVAIYETEISEQVRREKPDESASDTKQTELNADFRNLLIGGDCLSACAHLKAQNIKIDLVYIDPPFASGANYAKKIWLRNAPNSELETKGASIGEEVMYGDIWQKEDYLNWLYARLLAIREVMSETASIYVHLDWHIGHYVKIMLDEVFGEENFVNEIIWFYKDASGFIKKGFRKKHDTIFIYASSDQYYFDADSVRTEYAESTKTQAKNKATSYGRVARLNEKGKYPDDVWEMAIINSQAKERLEYATQKPEKLLQRIIKASSDEGMIVADFFSGSGTTAKVANDLKRKFIACDIGINALQTTRDRLAECAAEFDVLKIKDGMRLFRNPAQTLAKIFGIIDGYRSKQELELATFWDGGIAQIDGSYAPVKFVGIENLLSKELLNVFLEEVYKLAESASAVMIIYAHKDAQVDQDYVDNLVYKMARTEMKVQLVSLDDVLEDKRDMLFDADNAIVKMKRSKKDRRVEVQIEKFFSPYLYKKIEEFNAKKTRTVQKNRSKNAVTISDNGLEMIESVQFNTAGTKAWKSNPALEDVASKTAQIKGIYLLDTDKFKIKIRNIAGDEIVIDSKDIK